MNHQESPESQKGSPDSSQADFYKTLGTPEQQRERERPIASLETHFQTLTAGPEWDHAYDEDRVSGILTAAALGPNGLRLDFAEIKDHKHHPLRAQFGDGNEYLTLINATLENGQTMGVRRFVSHVS